MTPQELAEFKALAGITEPNPRQQKEAWARTQIRTPIAPTPMSPVEQLMNRLASVQPARDAELDGLAQRLNSSLGSDFASSVIIQRL